MALNFTQRNIASSFEFAEKAARAAVMNQRPRPCSSETSKTEQGRLPPRASDPRHRRSIGIIIFVQCKKFLLHCTNLSTILPSFSRRGACTQSCGGTLKTRAAYRGRAVR